MDERRGFVVLLASVVSISASAGALGFWQDGESPLLGAALTGAVGLAIVGVSFLIARYQRSPEDGAGHQRSPEDGAVGPKPSLEELRRRRNEAAIRVALLLLVIVLLWTLVFFAA